MIALEYDRRALREIDRAAEYFRRNGMLPADRFLHEVYALDQRLMSNPWLGTIYRKRFRWQKLKQYRYLAYYEIIGESRVVVYAVAHSSRKPGYWLYRTRNPQL